MPATAGRVRMPANNRVHSSAALQTHGIWQSTIGYDPYASTKEEKNKSSQKTSSALEPEPENAYTNYQGLLALAKITGSNTDEVRGACKKCGRVGHLTYQCRNFLSAKDEADKDPDSIHAAVLSGLEKLKGGRVKSKGKNEESSDEEEEEEESESSDSDYDSEIERAIAEKYGKRVTNGKFINDKKSKKRNDDSDESSDDEDREMRKEKRGRSKKRSSVKRGRSDYEDEDEGKRKRRKDERRRRDDDQSSDEEEERRRKSRKEKRRRRSHHYPNEYYSDGQRHKRRSRRDHSRSDSDVSGSDDPRVGRDKTRSEKKKKSRHHHHHHHRLEED